MNGMNYIGLEIIGDKRGNYFGNVIYLFNICLIVTHIIDKFLRSGWTTFISWPLKFSKRSLSLSLFLTNVACSTMNFFPDNDIILIEDIRDFLPLHSFLPSNFSTFDSFLLVVISIRFPRIRCCSVFKRKGKFSSNLELEFFYNWFAFQERNFRILLCYSEIYPKFLSIIHLRIPLLKVENYQPNRFRNAKDT